MEMRSSLDVLMVLLCRLVEVYVVVEDGDWDVVVREVRNMDELMSSE